MAINVRLTRQNKIMLFLFFLLSRCWVPILGDKLHRSSSVSQISGPCIAMSKYPHFRLELVSHVQNFPLSADQQKGNKLPNPILDACNGNTELRQKTNSI